MAKSGNRVRKGQQRSTARLIVAIGAIALLGGGLLVVNARGAHAHHPQPRAHANELRTLAATHYPAHSHAAVTYARAGKIKSTLDGLFCYCHCKGAGHYSLLDCFRDEHGAGCDICMAEANLAYEMSQNGATLNDIRAAIERELGP